MTNSVAIGTQTVIIDFKLSVPLPGYHRLLHRAPAAVTVVAALLGGALQGIVEALVAIAAAAALLLLT